MNNTFSLHKTNVRLTGNIKHVIDTKQNLFIESINSTQYLASSIYKGFEFSDKFSYGTNVRNFINNFTNKDSIYDVVDETKINISNSLSNQYHQLYNYGCYSEESQLIDENFRFFAPIHISEDETEWPDKFVILKMSGSSTATESTDDWFNKGTLIHSFDLSKIKKNIFSQIDKSYIDMSYETEISANGLNINTGLTNRVSEYSINELLENETTITEFDNWITNIYRRHGLIFSNIVNLEFAFTDTKIDNLFVRYAGFYVKSNVLEKEKLDNFENSGVLRLIKKETGVKKYANTDIIESYDVQAFSSFANSFGLNKRQICEFDFKLNPTVGSKLIIKYGNNIEYTFKFTTATIGQTIEITKRNIIKDISDNYTGSSTSVSAYLIGSKIRLESNVTSLTDENITIEVPIGFIVKKPLFGENPTNRFIGSTPNSVITNTYINPVAFPKLMYLYNGIKVVNIINRVYEYKGDWIYELNNPILRDSKPDNIWFMKTITDEPILGSIIEHKELDMFTKQSQYSDILDFDIDLYRLYLENTVNDPLFQGSVLAYYGVDDISQITPQQLLAYKQLLLSRVNSFFSSIEVDRNYLLKDIDISTLEATTVTNEYDRLQENNNVNLIRSNRLYEFINKWKYVNGEDVYNNDYRLNIALPFRYDNFSPSNKTVNRDIRYHSHSWFIIGEGRPPYYEINETNVKKLLSYTKYPITKELLENTEDDAYDLMKYCTDIDSHEAWSMIYFDEYQQSCYTFFKGVLYQFDSKDLAGYRFSVILKSSIPVLDDVFKMNIYQNDKFKTLTMFINFYIPDPILTLSEQGQEWYYLDRSLLYFSNEIYSTTDNSIDFGTDRISLDLYNNSKIKNYLNQPVTTEWYHVDPSAGRILFVGRGDSSIFNVDMNDLLTVGGNFVIKYLPYSDDQTSNSFGMTITFNNIVEVTKDYFWCKEIIVRSNKTFDPDGEDDDDIFDNIVDEIVTQNVWVEFENNPLIFRQDNIVYISKGIAAENCLYDKVISSSANNARYKEISLSNIKNVLSYTPVRINESNKYLQMSVMNPTEFSSLIRLRENNSNLVQLGNQYRYPMSRYAGESEPQVSTLSRFYDSLDYKNIYPSNEAKSISYRNIVSKIANNLQYVSTTFEEFKPSVNINFYQYLKALVGSDTTYEDLSWISNPSEHRNRVSLVFNSDEKIYIDTTLQPIMSITSLLKDRVTNWVQLNSLFTIDEQNKFLNYKYNGSDISIVNIDIKNDVIESFITNTFLRIYRIESIVKSNGQIVQFNKSNSEIIVLEEQNTFDEFNQIRITFTR